MDERRVPPRLASHELPATPAGRPRGPEGQAPEDPGTTTLALHWAWAVIGPPTARRKYPWLAVFEVRPNAAFADIYDGTSRNDARTYVRRDARKVEKVCLRHLQELGLDTGPAE